MILEYKVYKTNESVVCKCCQRFEDKSKYYMKIYSNIEKESLNGWLKIFISLIEDERYKENNEVTYNEYYA